ncbi:putative L-serine dehydratase SDL1 [Lachnellula suecica]|uniref:L-serine ammonia-lyase n=1 Tax=Lachnellula suecica TaxID=602035 RepID=A0A8T9C3M7_9HELO|nr:putative L-serine dehydratase SDL1 [Lachnellula suecica]
MYGKVCILRSSFLPILITGLGNSTIVDELYQQLQGSPPDAIVCSVGGGGLLNGIMMGLERYGWDNLVTVIGMETRGADSLSQSVLAGQHITLPKITSIATSLGVKRVSEKTWEWAKRQNVHSVALSDADAALACVKLADDEKLLVEPACGVSVAACYHGTLQDLVPGFNEDSKVVIIVCGGSNANAETIAKYRIQYGGENGAGKVTY